MREYLKKMRTDRGLTMQQVADAFGISKQYYEMIESGERQKNMDIILVAKIADLFGVTLDYIVDCEKQLPRETEGATA